MRTPSIRMSAISCSRYAQRAGGSISPVVFAVVLFFSSTLAFGQVAPAGTKTEPKTPDPCTSSYEFATTDCALTWHGITLYGAFDAGVGWVSHGLPENGYNYEGESLVNRNGYQHRFLIAPNNLQQTGLGIRGKE